MPSHLSIPTGSSGFAVGLPVGGEVTNVDPVREGPEFAEFIDPCCTPAHHLGDLEAGISDGLFEEGRVGDVATACDDDFQRDSKKVWGLPGDDRLLWRARGDRPTRQPI